MKPKVCILSHFALYLPSNVANGHKAAFCLQFAISTPPLALILAAHDYTQPFKPDPRLMDAACLDYRLERLWRRWRDRGG
jgi:hypothetical protein